MANQRNFLGVADDQEQEIRFTNPVEIVSFGFVAGQEVASGDLVLEVLRPELKAELQIVQEKIQALRFENRESRSTMESEIVRLKADLQATLTELDSQIRRLQGQENAAQNLMNNLSTGSTEARANSMTSQEISSLNKRRRAVVRSVQSEVMDLESRLTMPERSVDAQIAELDKQRQDLDRQKADLRVFAKIDGQIGSVHFKVGDTVQPYQPVLTVHGSKPSFIKGYIHENVVNGIRLNQKVWVHSTSSNNQEGWQQGKVESLGSRIVEFPPRLKINPLAQAWGARSNY